MRPLELYGRRVLVVVVYGYGGGGYGDGGYGGGYSGLGSQWDEA